MKPRLAALVTIVFLLVVARPARAADTTFDGQWFHQFLNTAQAHQITRGEGVTVAVIDTGVDAAHPDLSGSVLPGTDLIDGQGDGHTDKDGHGTAMVSLIAAHGRLQGVAPAAKVLPIRATLVEQGRSTKFAGGIKWAVTHGAKVISISFGSNEDLLERQELEAAMAADVVVVAAAGNRPPDTSVRFPAATPGVVAVAAVDQNGNHADFSVSGPEVVIAAPGVGILGALPGGKYGEGSGTSDATAITAGAVALIRAKFPQLKAPEVVRRLTATAIDKGSPGRDPDYGFGVLNIVGALTADIPAATSPSVKSSSADVSAPPPSKPDRFAWWLLLLVAVPIAAIVIGAVIWSRRRDRTSQPNAWNSNP